MSTDPSLQPQRNGVSPAGPGPILDELLRREAFSGTEKEHAPLRSLEADRLQRAVSDITSLVIGMVPNFGQAGEWQVGRGSYLVAQYADLVSGETRARMRNPYGIFKAVTTLSDDALAGLPLNPEERESVREVRERLSALTDDDLRPHKKSNATCLCEITSIREDQLLLAVDAMARATVLKRMKADIAPVMAALNESAADGSIPFAPREYADRPSRFIAEASAQLKMETPVSFDVGWIDQREYHSVAADLSPDMRLSSQGKAVAIVAYLEKLTRAHSYDAQLSVEFLSSVKEKIAQRLEAGQHLRFSMYLSLEKFANPLDTKSSGIDIGEMRIALELAELVRAIEKITGKKPEILILNESAANHQFSNGDTASYSKAFNMLVEQAGLTGSVKVIDFDREFFTGYLEQRGYPSDQAGDLFDSSFALLKNLYSDILTGKVTRKNLSAIETHVISTYPEFPRRIAGAVSAFVAKHFDAISAEIQQSIHTERQGGVDLSLIIPGVPVHLLRDAFQLDDTAAPRDTAEGRLRSMVLEQAKHQGPHFKALMRMRYFVQEFCGGEPLLPREMISLSITNADNKLSVPMGRSAKSGVNLGRRPVPGVCPQHGAGVITNGRVVSLPWSEILDHEERFHPAEVSLGNVKLSGYIQTMRGVLADLDGTLKDHGKVVGDDVFALMNDTLRAGIPFGFATGRSAEGVERLIRAPFIRYLTDRGFDPADDCYKELFISGNNGARTSLGLLQPRLIEERELQIESFSQIDVESFTGVLLQNYLHIHGAGTFPVSEIDSSAYDAYCLYLEPPQLNRTLRDLHLDSISLPVIAGYLNDDFRRYNVPARALVNTKGIDIVDSSVSKGVSLDLYQQHLNQLNGRPNSENLVLCLGDNPTGNDLELLNNAGGRSDITTQGVAHVVNYTRAMLNIPSSPAK